VFPSNAAFSLGPLQSMLEWTDEALKHYSDTYPTYFALFLLLLGAVVGSVLTTLYTSGAELKVIEDYLNDPRFIRAMQEEGGGGKGKRGDTGTSSSGVSAKGKVGSKKTE
jgi:hypothetical protein